MMNNLFEKALSINPPWFVKEIRFDERQKKLDIFMALRRFEWAGGSLRSWSS